MEGLDFKSVVDREFIRDCYESGIGWMVRIVEGGEFCFCAYCYFEFGV